MTDFNRTTAEIVATMRAEIRARGRETEAAERWEGDGVWHIWIKQGTEGWSTRSVEVGGNDTGMDPGADLSSGQGGEPAGLGVSWDEAIDWLMGGGPDGPVVEGSVYEEWRAQATA